MFRDFTFYEMLEKRLQKPKKLSDGISFCHVDTKYIDIFGLNGDQPQSIINREKLTFISIIKFAGLDLKIL